jgi:GNAT superfamily N-acetyltransferase
LISVQYRPVREAEIPETAELFLTTVADLYQRHNVASPLPPQPFVEKVYDHIRRTGIFRVAEIDGHLVAICHAVVRNALWFLSAFWTLPQMQGQKIGRPLLQQVWDEGARDGARKFFTWSSIDLQAMAAYMKFDMLPGYQILTFAGTMNGSSQNRSDYETQPLDISTAMLIDEQIRETRREIDHRFWLSEMEARGRKIIRDGRIVGYYYFQNGTIGPAAWLNEEDAEAILETACYDASEQSEQIRLMIPGLNHDAIRFALRAGLRLAAYSHLLTTAPFGQMDKYLPSGPSLF